MNELERVLQLCRKYGVTALELGETKLVLGPAQHADVPATPAAQREEVDPTTGLTRSQYTELYHSVSG